MLSIIILINMILLLVSVATISFFFKDTPTTEIYTLSLHDALPIYLRITPQGLPPGTRGRKTPHPARAAGLVRADEVRSEEHTSELQSQAKLVCRLLLEKKTR